MRILYGVVGVGMGHAIRSHAVLKRLCQDGHVVLVLSSGKAFDFLSNTYKDHEHVTVEKIQGFRFSLKNNNVDIGRTAASILWNAPKDIYHNVRVYFEHINEWKPEIVLTDFETLTSLYALAHNKPLVCIDNIHVLDRCKHKKSIWKGNWIARVLAQTGVKLKVMAADHYFITSAFRPPVRAARTTLVGPILRQEIKEARRDPGDRYLIYLHGGGNEYIYDELKKHPGQFIFYGTDRSGSDKNIEFKEFSEKGFVEDLRTCKGLISTAGSSLMSEAIYLRVPMMAIPMGNQYEQILNARYLNELGLGMYSNYLDVNSLTEFQYSLRSFESNLKKYKFATSNPLDIISLYVKEQQLK